MYTIIYLFIYRLVTWAAYCFDRLDIKISNSSQNTRKTSHSVVTHVFRPSSFFFFVFFSIYFRPSATINRSEIRYEYSLNRYYYPDTNNLILRGRIFHETPFRRHPSRWNNVFIASYYSKTTERHLNRNKI